MKLLGKVVLSSQRVFVANIKVGGHILMVIENMRGYLLSARNRNKNSKEKETKKRKGQEQKGKERKAKENEGIIERGKRGSNEY